MKKPKLIAMLISLLFAACHYGTGVGEKKKTPPEFINDTKVNPALYENDKRTIVKQLYGFLLQHKKPFESDEYFDSTELKVDTILYSKAHDSVSVFVLAKNPVSRQLVPNKEYRWYCDAYCYLGIREKDTFMLKWLRPYSLSSFYDEKKAAEELRNQFFTTFATLKDTSGAYVYKYNLDDKRFWQSAVWEKYFNCPARLPPPAIRREHNSKK